MATTAAAIAPPPTAIHVHGNDEDFSTINFSEFEVLPPRIGL